MSVHIIIDSSTDVNPAIEKQLKVVPMSILFGQDVYTDGVTIDRARFYQMLVESDVLPTTSMATPEDFAQVLRPIVAAGDSAVIITLTAKFSGTWHSAVVAAEECGGKVRVVDSDSVALGTGILAEEALRMRDQGMTADQIADELEVRKKDVRLIAMLDTLEYLRKGGRLSAAAAFAGTLLSLKPVVAVEEGVIKMRGKARGSRQGNNLLVQEISKAGGVDLQRPVLLGWTGLNDTLLRKYMEDSKHLWQDLPGEPVLCCVSGVVGVHTGPGTIAAAFFAANRQ